MAWSQGRLAAAGPPSSETSTEESPETSRWQMWEFQDKLPVSADSHQTASTGAYRAEWYSKGAGKVCWCVCNSVYFSWQYSSFIIDQHATSQHKQHQCHTSVPQYRKLIVRQQTIILLLYVQKHWFSFLSFFRSFLPQNPWWVAFFSLQ